MAQRHKRVVVNATVCEFALVSRQSQLWVPPLNMQYLQNSAQNGMRSVLTLASLYLPATYRIQCEANKKYLNIYFLAINLKLEIKFKNTFTYPHSSWNVSVMFHSWLLIFPHWIHQVDLEIPSRKSRPKLSQETLPPPAILTTYLYSLDVCLSVTNLITSKFVTILS